ncbi:MAG: FlgD immunoglobulin-like domain containing protein, partial [Brevinematia bacterium]
NYYNISFVSSPYYYLRLGSSHSFFYVTNIRINKSNFEFFYNLFVDVDLTPSTVVDLYVMDGKTKTSLFKFNLNSSQKKYFFSLYDVLPRNTDEIYFLFSSTTPSPFGGNVNSIVVTKEIVLESSVGENQVKVYPNPVMVGKGHVPKIVVNVKESSYLTVVVFDSRGNIVKTVTKDQLFEGGIFTFNWDLKDDRGINVPSGKYIVFSSVGSYRSTFSFIVIR